MVTGSIGRHSGTMMVVATYEVTRGPPPGLALSRSGKLCRAAGDPRATRGAQLGSHAVFWTFKVTDRALYLTAEPKCGPSEVPLTFRKLPATALAVTICCVSPT